MKKILIVNNNLQVGGIQKSLVNLLKVIHGFCDITLLLFSDYGDLIGDIPDDVNIMYADRRLSILGTPWKSIDKSLSNISNKLISRLLLVIRGKESALTYLFSKQKLIEGFDTVISYSQCTPENSLSVCVPEFVLKCVESDNKVCFIHCDYKKSDTCSKYNNDIYKRFDRIVCCSKSVKKNFVEMIPDIERKTFWLRNFKDYSIVDSANNNTYEYDNSYINIISVSRLSEEKGIYDAIESLRKSNRLDIRYYIIGTGPQEKYLKRIVKERKMMDIVYFFGEQDNPYRFMINADYLLVPSKHEAAPMVFDEAHILGLSIISTNTTSAKEMLYYEDIIVDEMNETVIENIKKSCVRGKTMEIKSETNENDDYMMFKHVVYGEE